MLKLVATLGLASVVGVSADIPMHCAIQDVVGTWKLYLGALKDHNECEDGVSDNCDYAIPQCGHEIPNTWVSMA